jgi:hypothetical protein
MSWEVGLGILSASGLLSGNAEKVETYDGSPESQENLTDETDQTSRARKEEINGPAYQYLRESGRGKVIM